MAINPSWLLQNFEPFIMGSQNLKVVQLKIKWGLLVIMSEAYGRNPMYTACVSPTPRILPLLTGFGLSQLELVHDLNGYNPDSLGHYTIEKLASRNI